MRAAAPGAAGAAAPPPADAAPDGADSLTAAKDPEYDRRWAAFGQYGERLGPLFDRAVARKHILKRLRGILKSLPRGRGTAMGAKCEAGAHTGGQGQGQGETAGKRQCNSVS